jgi:hypothetical protein
MKMLVCYDGTERAESGLKKSIALFKPENLEIILVAVVEEPMDASSNNEAIFDALRAEKEAELKETVDWVAKQGFSVDAIVAIGDPRKMLVAAAKNKKPDIVVITSRPPKGGIRFGNITVSVSDYLIHHIDECPVLIMH